MKRRATLLFGVLLACGSDETSAPASGDAGGADWALHVGAPPAGKVTTALLGHYDLSGALFHYDQVPGLVGLMKTAGMANWRVGVGRWENTTLLQSTLTDGTACPFAEPTAFAGKSELEVLASRDWFIDDGSDVTLAATQDDARYNLAYVRSVLDVASAFGSKPLVDIDHMPRAFAVNRTPSRAASSTVPEPCVFSWTNRVSNVRPADAYLASTPSAPPIFATAALGLVKRLAEGSGATDFEFWNEPDLPYAWDLSFDDASRSHYFETALQVLVLLDAYRTQSGKPLRFGLGSFAHADVAVAAIQGLDASPAPPPLDFVSFHSYANDPLVIVADIEKVIAARAASVHYASKELALTEWGPDLTSTPDPATMDASLLVATVLALGATLGLEQAYQAIFYDFYAGIPFGLVDHEGRPKALYQAYVLLAQAIAGGGDRLGVVEHADGRLDDGQGAVLVTRDSSGKVRALFVNREVTSKTASVAFGNDAAKAPTQLTRFDDPKAAPHVDAPSATFVLPARSITLAEW